MRGDKSSERKNRKRLERMSVASPIFLNGKYGPKEYLTITINTENACRGAAESPVFCREGAGGMGMNQGNLFLNQKQIISISETNYFYFRNKLFLFQKH
jgi:hypothetical protein